MNDGSSPPAIIDFLLAIQKFDEIPKETTYEEMSIFSFVMQECIIQRINHINSKAARNSIHGLCCSAVIKLLHDFKVMNDFKIDN